MHHQQGLTCRPQVAPVCEPRKKMVLQSLKSSFFKLFSNFGAKKGTSWCVYSGGPSCSFEASVDSRTIYIWIYIQSQTILSNSKLYLTLNTKTCIPTVIIINRRQSGQSLGRCSVCCNTSDLQYQGHLSCSDIFNSRRWCIFRGKKNGCFLSRAQHAYF